MPMTCAFLNDLTSVDFIEFVSGLSGRLIQCSNHGTAAALYIKFLLAFVRTRTFIPFGIYRIVIALAFALVIYAHD